MVRQRPAVDALRLRAGVEAEVRDADTEPAHEASDGGHVDEPVEDLARAVGHRHVREEAEQRVQDHGHPRETPAINAREDLWGVAVECEAVCKSNQYRDIGEDD